MARKETPKAGEYEQFVDAYQEYDEKGNLVATYEKGDIVALTAEQAERLTTGPNPAFGEPGALAQAEADRLQEQAEALHARAQDAKARAAEAAKVKSGNAASQGTAKS